MTNSLKKPWLGIWLASIPMALGGGICGRQRDTDKGRASSAGPKDMGMGGRCRAAGLLGVAAAHSELTPPPPQLVVFLLELF